MTQNKILYAIIAVLVLIIIGGAFFIFIKPSTETEESGQPETNNSQSTEGQAFSEQPNKQKFDEYFTSAALAKLPAGSKFDPFKIIKTNVFSSSEQFCTTLEIKKRIPAGGISTAVYDVNAKQEIQPKTSFPQELKTGGSVGCQDLAQSAGKYEYKIYVDNVLAVVLPFEVK